MRLFLTATCGFLGRHITSELLQAGHHVTGLARSSDAAAVLSAQGVVPVMGDITHPASIDAALAAAEGVMPTAASVWPGRVYRWS